MEYPVTYIVTEYAGGFTRVCCEAMCLEEAKFFLDLIEEEYAEDPDPWCDHEFDIEEISSIEDYEYWVDR